MKYFLAQLSSNKYQQISIFALIFIAFVMRVTGLDGIAFWLDEALTVSTSSLPWSTLWVTSYDPTPPLFYSVEKLILNLGDSEFLLRFPSVIFNVISIYFMYKATHLVAGFRGGVIAAIFLTISISNVAYAQEARAYSLLGLMLSIAFLGMIKLSLIKKYKDGDFNLIAFLKNGGLLYGFGVAGALYSHNIAVFFVLGVHIYFFLLAFIDKSRFKLLYKYWYLLNLLVFMLWLPWLIASIELMSTKQFSWLPHYDFDIFTSIVIETHGFTILKNIPSFIDVTAGIFIVTGLYYLKEKPHLLALCLLLLLSSTLFIWLASYIKPIFMARTIVWGTIISAFIIGILFSKINSYFYFSGLVILILIGANNYYFYAKNKSEKNENWRASVNFVEKSIEKSDSIVFCSDYVSTPFAYYSNHELLKENSIFGWSISDRNLKKGKFNKNGKYHPTVSWEPNPVSSDSLLGTPRIWLIQSNCSDPEMNKISNFIEAYKYSKLFEAKAKGVKMHLYIN